MKLLTLLCLFLGGYVVQTRPAPVGLTEFATLEPAATGRTFYVSGNGADARSGLSEAEAFRTLQRAADQTAPGDTVLVMNGAYSRSETGGNVLEITTSGEPDNWIQYRAYPDHTPVIKSKGNYAGIYTNAAYILIEGFTVEGDAPNLTLEYALQEQENLSNPVTNSTGIAAYGRDGVAPHHLIIRKNHVFNCPSSGIFANNADYVRIEDNLVHDNSKYSPYATSGVSFYQSRDVDDETGVKMVIRRNTVYGNENLVPFHFSSEVGAGARVVTDGNGIIVDDGRNSQAFVGTPGVSYGGTTLVSDNLVFGNGGRGVNVYSSDNVIISYNTTYHNAKSDSTAITSELVLGGTTNVEVYGNIFVARPDRKPVSSYSTKKISFSNNLFHGGSSAPEYPPGTLVNLVKNGDFSGGTRNWEVTNASRSGKDARGRFCLSSSTEETALYQTGLALGRGTDYALSFELSTDGAAGRIDVILKDAAGDALFERSVEAGSEAKIKTLTVSLDANVEDVRLEFRLAPDAPGGLYCLDTIELIGSDNLVADPEFVNPGTDPAEADFRLKDSSPARDAGTTPFPETDVGGTPRPKGDAPDLGAYESF